MPINVVSLMRSVSWTSGASTRPGRSLELLGDGDQREHDHHRRATGAQRLAHAHLFGADAGQEVVGQDRDRGTRGLVLLAARFFGQHRGCERSRVLVPSVGIGLHHFPVGIGNASPSGRMHMPSNGILSGGHG